VSLWPLPNVWLGVSVENQATADERLSYLCELGIDGWQTMVSFEPLLGNIMPLPKRWLDLGPRTWAIVGGESGPGARPMHPDWARVLRDPCISYRVPFFFKQWGEWLPAMQDGRAGNGQILNASDVPERVGKHAAGALLDGMEWKQFPEARA
jgi:protein gp37